MVQLSVFFIRLEIIVKEPLFHKFWHKYILNKGYLEIYAVYSYPMPSADKIIINIIQSCVNFFCFVFVTGLYFILTWKRYSKITSYMIKHVLCHHKKLQTQQNHAMLLVNWITWLKFVKVWDKMYSSRNRKAANRKNNKKQVKKVIKLTSLFF